MRTCCTEAIIGNLTDVVKEFKYLKYFWLRTNGDLNHSSLRKVLKQLGMKPK